MVPRFTKGAEVDLIAFIREFTVWWDEAGRYYYSEDCIHEDEGLKMLADKATALRRKIEDIRGGQ